MTRGLLAILLSLGIAGSAFAQCGSFYRPVTYYKPTYSYSYATVYPKAVAAVQYADYYSTANDYYRDKLLVDAMAGKAAELSQTNARLEALTNMLQRMGGGQYPQNGYQQQYPPQQSYPQQYPNGNGQQYPAQQPMPQAQPPSNGNGSPLIPPLETSTGGRGQSGEDPKLVAMYQQSCVQCHSAETAQTMGNGFRLDNLSGIPEATRWKMFGLLASGEMPKGRQQVDDATLQSVYAWAKKAGAGTTATVRR